MSKLAHSHIPTMRWLDAKAALKNGYEDLFGLTRIVPESPPICEAKTPPHWYRPEGGRCPRRAVWRTKDGAQLCTTHAELLIAGEDK